VLAAAPEAIAKVAGRRVAATLAKSGIPGRSK
jgi:hypothetical protein